MAGQEKACSENEARLGDEGAEDGFEARSLGGRSGRPEVLERGPNGCHARRLCEQGLRQIWWEGEVGVSQQERGEGALTTGSSGSPPVADEGVYEGIVGPGKE
jgi:hypothetical protein